MKNLMFIFTCILLFLSSCRPSAKSITIPELDLKLSEEWIYTDKLLGLKKSGEKITRPAGFEQLVMELVIPEQGGLNYKKHCVYYLIPYKEKKGQFKVQAMKTLDACSELSDSGMTFAQIEDIDHLKITLLNFKLKLDFTYQKNQKSIEIPLPNLEAGLIHEKYNPQKEKRLMSGLKFLRLGEDSFDFGTNRYLGKLSDRFSRNTAIRCQQVNKDCETVGENRCDECRYGWYEVVDFQCPQGGSKFCGQNHCGEKNEPACPRGVKVVDPEEAGICQNDLEPVVNADKILVCQ